MSVLEIAKKRYSVRNYRPDKVEKEKLLEILEAGRVAPTGANAQPYRLIVVQEDEGLGKIKKAANIFGAPLAIIVCGDRNQVWKRPFDGKSILDIDTSIITDHMMLQATELGLGSVWICYFKPDVIRAEFNLPDNLEPVNILAIGYANGESASPDRHERTRRPLSEIVSYERL
ncbi:MAG: nitroreductase family protein [Clostridia bacterium]|nr:nitroreductase family protein [Clostridia bacterium]